MALMTVDKEENGDFRSKDGGRRTRSWTWCSASYGARSWRRSAGRWASRRIAWPPGGTSSSTPARRASRANGPAQRRTDASETPSARSVS